MKKGKKWLNSEIERIYDKYDAFYAFSDKQYKEGRKKGVGYISMGGGLLVPKNNAREFHEVLMNAMNEHKAYMRNLLEDTKEREELIKYELNNYECFYTGDIYQCVESLKEYDISRDEIAEVFQKEYRLYSKIENI
jgi:hypothetical protein